MNDNLKLIMADPENTNIMERYNKAYNKGLDDYLKRRGFLWDCLTKQMEAEGLIPKKWRISPRHKYGNLV